VNGRQDLLRLEGVEKQYSRQRILHVDNLMLREGDLVEISGANGSGKSTLLKLLGGITPADHGCIWRAPVMKSSVLGYQPQNGGLYGDLSIQDNLLLRRLLYGLKTTDIEEVWYIRDLGLVLQL
jgi:ABC-type multidrug transport system ATPase subunit